ncbi:hypothetical protein CPC1998_0312 [Chlamydia psittaci C19/98]|nr:hypothetical protein CX655_02960 [Chlamydia psittaci]EPJ16596.1 hypothetical protein CP02DC22_1039 [Chlamydia psittaci 02DC22]EPJ29175.1 hypothetical protein CPC1998_0312 [Chlamydia psittaci C19/98]EPP33345.1 hypothetical protein CPC698_0927 [Chlamydia psittaci C6/98]
MGECCIPLMRYRIPPILRFSRNSTPEFTRSICYTSNNITLRKDLKVDSFNLSIIYLPKTRSSSSRNKKNINILLCFNNLCFSSLIHITLG